MSNILLTDSFQRPASYWLRRADRSKQAGNLLRAVVMERHATRTEPASTPAAVSYALTLRQMHCYEASNREAFAALARDPGRFALYGLVGLNLMEMGMAEGALDAVAMYMNGAEQSDAELPPWDGDVCALEEMYWEPPARRRARFYGLCRIVYARVARGDLPAARRALHRMSQPPYQGASLVRDMLRALYLCRAKKGERALEVVRRTLSSDRCSVRIRVMGARLLWQLGQRREARAVLLRAACHAAGPVDGLQICLAADDLNCPSIALAMLRRALSRKPDRYPVCYNLSVCLLRLGRMEEASQRIHFCRELDPDDVPGEMLFARVQEWRAKELTPRQLRREAMGVGYYGTMTRQELVDCVMPLLTAWEQGIENFARQLAQDDKLRRRYLYALAMPDDILWRLLPELCAHLPAKEAERLLREILLQSWCRPSSKRSAASLLAGMGVAPPYPMWYDGRITQIDPNAPPMTQAAFLPRRLTRAIARAARMETGMPLPWAMKILSHLPRRKQLCLAGYPSGVVAAALCARYHHLHTHRAPVLPPATLRRPATLRSALAILRQSKGKGE